MIGQNNKRRYKKYLSSIRSQEGYKLLFSGLSQGPILFLSLSGKLVSLTESDVWSDSPLEKI